MAGAAASMPVEVKVEAGTDTNVLQYLARYYFVSRYHLQLRGCRF